MGSIQAHLEFPRLKAKAGEVTEWLKVHAWNACVRKYREFESHPLRHKFDLGVIAGSPCNKESRTPSGPGGSSGSESLCVPGVPGYPFFEQAH
jgi:hypothetical protein